jgi:hypothetical protein
MGGFAAGLASVGGSLAEAQDLKRQEQIEQIKLALEQARLRTEQQYASSNQERIGLERSRLGIERSREERLAAEAKKPTISKWQLMGNTMIAAGQNADGSPFVKSIQLNPEVGYQLKALKDEIAQAPPEAQPMLEAMTNGYIAEGNIKGATDAIRPVLQAIAKDKALPGQETVREGCQALTVDVPGYGPMIVQVPTRSVTRKVPRGESGSALIPPIGPEDTSIPTPLTSGATDRPNAPQSGSIATGGSLSTSNLPKIPLPPGSRMIGVKPPPGAKGQLKPEMEAGLRVLHVSLFGTPSVPGLASAVDVLDSKASRALLISAGVGTTPDPSQWTITKLAHAGVYSMMSAKERNYVYQLNRAISAINALRSITGLPRSTQQLMDQYIRELPNPITTPSSKDALNQLTLIEREIRAAMDTGTGEPATKLPSAPVDIDKTLDSIFGAPSGGPRNP